RPNPFVPFVANSLERQGLAEFQMKRGAGPEREIRQLGVGGIARNQEPGERASEDAGNTSAFSADECTSHAADSRINHRPATPIWRRAGKRIRDPGSDAPAIGQLDLTKYQPDAAFRTVRRSLDGFHPAIQTASLRHNDLRLRSDGIHYGSHD